MIHKKYPSIGQFRNAVYDVNRTHEFVGLDANDEPIYDKTKEKPVLTFTGTVKIHGTNAAVSFNDKDGLYAQSRKNVIAVGNDNAGFAAFVEEKKDIFMKLVQQVKDAYEVNTKDLTITIYGEWAGKGVQRGIAISQLEKTFYIIGVRLSLVEELEEANEGEDASRWVDASDICTYDARICNILHFKTFTIDIDFNRPDLAQNKIIEMTLSVEEECPVAKHFGITGVGEGIVFTHVKEDGSVLMFKSKGEKHSKSKVKKLTVVDSEKVQKLIDTANQVTPAWRLSQFLTEVCNLNNGGQIDRKSIPEYIRAVIADVVKEDSDIISAAGFTLKDLGKYISKNCTNYFFEQERV